MRGLVQTFLAGLSSERPSPELLGELGEPDPPKAAAAFRAAARHPDLRATLGDWAPVALTTARPGFAAQVLEELAGRYRQARGVALDLGRHPALVRVLGSSDMLARLLLRHPHWVEELDGAPPDGLPEAPGDGPIEPDWTAIRVAKYRGLLRIAARDLLGRDFHDSLTELTSLADRCLAAGLACAEAEVGVEPPALLALGKLGGRELNFSSDVDLIFVHEPAGDRPDPKLHAALGRLIQTFKKHMEAPSEDGFGYRVDLDLRPEGRSGGLINTVDGALEYYESFGADWERQMLIRLRRVAGPEAPGRAFADQVVPFVYRQLIDPGSIGAIRDMKLRIESERRDSGKDLEIELKEGPGGIRDVEFLTQAFQLLFGGRHPELRTGHVLSALEALEALERLRLLPEAVTTALSDAYLWLRRAEHCVQLVEERQTQRFPRDPVQQLGLARRMGYDDEQGARARDRLLDDWTHVRATVREHFNALILEAPSDAGV